MTDPFTLGGHVALVTGAGQGIGQGVALAMARAGADVAVVQVEDELGPLSIAFNNAGIAIGDVPTENLSAVAWRKVVDVNLTGVFLCAQAEARVMLPRGGGTILNMASMSGSIVNRGLYQPNYNASKAGVAHSRGPSRQNGRRAESV